MIMRFFNLFILFENDPNLQSILFSIKIHELHCIFDHMLYVKQMLSSIFLKQNFLTTNYVFHLFFNFKFYQLIFLHFFLAEEIYLIFFSFLYNYFIKYLNLYFRNFLYLIRFFGQIFLFLFESNSKIDSQEQLLSNSHQFFSLTT